MRHGKKFNHLGRKKGHRTALLRNMSAQLIEHKRIVTTLAKAKALRVHIEPLVTKAKQDNTHNRRVVFSYLQNKEAIKELFGTVAAKVASRPGGYLRIIKMGHRKGDGAEMAMIEFVDFNETMLSNSSSAEGKSRRTRRGRKKSSDTATTTAATAAAAATTAEVEAPKAETPAVESPTTSTEAADDLTKIEGIGPKIASLLNGADITTYSALAGIDPEIIRGILESNGLGHHIPDTWGKQAQMAADGEWEALKAWQDELDGGKE